MDVNVLHLDHALKMVFTPLCRLLIRCGIPVRHVVAVLKQSYIDAAQLEIERDGGRLSTSEISRLTGITRQEVARYRNAPQREVPEEVVYPVRDAAVLSTWCKNLMFVDDEGTPLPLPFEGEGASFSELVGMSYDGADAEVLADRLVASGNVERRDDGYLVLARQNVSVNANLPQLILDALAAPASTLIPNTQPDPRNGFCQRVAFIARPNEAQVETCRFQMRNRIASFIEATDQHLVALTAADSMTEKASPARGVGKIGVGAFYFELDE